MPYAPNPIPIIAAKIAGYSLLGWTVRRWSWRRHASVVSFVAARIVAGWALLFCLSFLVSWLLPRLSSSDAAFEVIFLVPRLAIWAFLIHRWFEPRGGVKALAGWSLLGTAISAGIDLIVLENFENVDWLRMAFC